MIFSYLHHSLSFLFFKFCWPFVSWKRHLISEIKLINYSNTLKMINNDMCKKTWSVKLFMWDTDCSKIFFSDIFKIQKLKSTLYKVMLKYQVCLAFQHVDIWTILKKKNILHHLVLFEESNKELCMKCIQSMKQTENLPSLGKNFVCDSHFDKSCFERVWRKWYFFCYFVLNFISAFLKSWRFQSTQ